MAALGAWGAQSWAAGNSLGSTLGTSASPTDPLGTAAPGGEALKEEHFPVAGFEQPWKGTSALMGSSVALSVPPNQRFSSGWK